MGSRHQKRSSAQVMHVSVAGQILKNCWRNPSYKGKGGLTQKMHKHLRSAARCMIKTRSQQPDTKKKQWSFLSRILWMVLYTALAYTANVALKVAREISTANMSGSVGNSQNDAQSSCESSDEDDRSCKRQRLGCTPDASLMGKWWLIVHEVDHGNTVAWEQNYC